jgi:hypothetical protein
MAKGQTSKLDFLSHHEAGHAAIARALGIRLGPVRIKQETDSGDATLTYPTEHPPTDVQKVLIALAGGRAERRLDSSFVGQRLASVADEICASNTIEACLFRRLEGRSWPSIDDLQERVDSRLARVCARMVEEQWPAIQRLAAALVLQRQLSGEEAEKVLAGEDD